MKVVETGSNRAVVRSKMRRYRRETGLVRSGELD